MSDRVFTEESLAVFTKELAAQIIQLEREACAESCEKLKDLNEPENSNWNSACRIAAARIRSRGNHD